ncbi:MAG: hypothetical protein ACK48I_12120 [Bacteroidota bacterium]|jgi:hypothetical protein
MGVNILQIFRGSIILDKSPSSDIPCVCLMFGAKSVGFSLISWPRLIFAFGHIFSFKYWIALLIGFLFSLSGVMFSASSSRRSLENTATAFRWDGLINNIPALVDSYWYLVKLNEIETLRGNFTLMR